MSEPIVIARDLTRTYELSRGLLGKPAVVRALVGASFSLEAGRTLAIVGESGCGKSTLARIVTMIERASDGDLMVDGVIVGRETRAERRRLRRLVRIVFQNPYGSLNPRQKIGEALAEPLAINTSVPRAKRRDMAHEMLARVGLRPEHYGRYPHMFSGGQRQRISIARALMLGPRVLVLDEPVSALDLSIRAQILNLLAELKASLSLAYLFISHDISVVRHVADEVMVMYLGRPVEVGPAIEVLERPRHPYTRALLAATPVADPARRRDRVAVTGEMPSPFSPPAGCAFHPRCAHANARCRVEIPRLVPARTSQVACHGVSEGRG